MNDLLKLFTALLTPLGFAMTLALLGLLLNRRWWVALALGWLWLWSTPWVAVHSARALERPYPLRTAAEMPSADAIVLLGGAVGARTPGWHERADLNAAADRLHYTLQLWRAGKAGAVLYSGGAALPARGIRAEADEGTDVLVEWGMPRDIIQQEVRSLTTRQNAAYSLPMLTARGVKTVLLVTSVWHMERSLATFRQAAADQGLAMQFIAAPCDPMVLTPVAYRAMLFLPSSEALEVSRRLFKEWLGILWLQAGGR